MQDDHYEITTPAAEEPLTLVETKAWLRVEHTDDDTLITALIESARRVGEMYCNRIFVATTFDCYYAGLETSNCEPFPFVQIRRSPLIGINSVEIYSGGAYAATTDYDVKNNSGGFPRLIFQDGIVVDEDHIFPIKVSAEFGYGDANDVPEAIKTALKAHIAFLYENRGDTVSEGKISLPLETKSIYSGKYRILNTY